MVKGWLYASSLVTLWFVAAISSLVDMLLSAVLFLCGILVGIMFVFTAETVREYLSAVKSLEDARAKSFKDSIDAIAAMADHSLTRTVSNDDGRDLIVFYVDKAEYEAAKIRNRRT